jgi:Uma2 family endonuclease
MSQSSVASGSEKRRPPRVLSVVADPDPDEVGARIDWSSWYLTDEEDMGQSPEHDQVAQEFCSSLRQLGRERGWERRLVGNDHFFGWIESEPLVRISPDAFVLDDPPEPWPKSWQLWRPGHRAPRFAVELVSDDWKKDYEQSPAKYAMLGTDELVIYDLDAAGGRARAPRVPLQLYRREDDGRFVRVAGGAGPVQVSTIDAWIFIEQLSPHQRRLRVSRSASPADAVPTEGQAVELERARAEAERARAEAERARAEAALRELTELRAKLER